MYLGLSFFLFIETANQATPHNMHYVQMIECINGQKYLKTGKYLYQPVYVCVCLTVFSAV